MCWRRIAGADDLVPEVDRPGLVPAEEQQVLAALAQGVEGFLWSARRVDDADVGLFETLDLRRVAGVANSDGLGKLDREIRPALDLVQFALDADEFLGGVLLRLNAAPGPPACLRSRFRNIIDQDGFDHERPAVRSGPVARLGRRGDGRPGQAAQGHADGPGAADARQKASAAESLGGMFLSAAARTAGGTHRRSCLILVRHVSSPYAGSRIPSDLAVSADFHTCQHDQHAGNILRDKPEPQGQKEEPCSGAAIRLQCPLVRNRRPVVSPVTRNREQGE